MKEMSESLILMLEKHVITPKQAKELFLRAWEEYIKPEGHIHRYIDEDVN